jgi:hypothetical protein
MNLPQTGGCQCGKIRYEITEIPQLVQSRMRRSAKGAIRAGRLSGDARQLPDYSRSGQKSALARGTDAAKVLREIGDRNLQVHDCIRRPPSSMGRF